MTATELITEIVTQRPDCFPNGTELQTGDFIGSLARMVGAQYVVEMGTHYGLTTLQICEAILPHGTIVTIDQNRLAEPIFKQYEHGDHVQYEQGDTRTWNGYMQMVDLLFIDTTHEFEQTFKEIETAWRWLKPGAIIALHDVYHCTGVREALYWFESRGMVKSLSFSTQPKPPRACCNGLAVAVKLTQSQ